MKDITETMSFRSEDLRRDTIKHVLRLVQEALEYGNVSGWLCVQGRGAIPSLPTRQEIERHLV